MLSPQDVALSRGTDPKGADRGRVDLRAIRDVHGRLVGRWRGATIELVSRDVTIDVSLHGAP